MTALRPALARARNEPRITTLLGRPSNRTINLPPEERRRNRSGVWNGFGPGLGGARPKPTVLLAAEQAAAAPQSGQAAFAAISEIVKKLRADPSTDWSKVNIEALRQHLVDMDNVVMRSTARATNVDGGVSLGITGTGDVAAAIRRMGAMHAMALTEDGEYVAKSSDITGGVRFVVTAKSAGDAKVVVRIRGLGFAGIFAEGDHHAMHHLELARGGGMMHQHKP